MLSATSQISIKSALESLKTWKSLKNRRSTSDLSTKKNDIFNVVMTPDRIPKFFIPSLEVDHIFVHIEPTKDVQEAEKEKRVSKKESISTEHNPSNSDSNFKKGSLLKEHYVCRKSSDYSSENFEKVAEHSDPATRAALSLPHLPKITTPYGFLTIGERPNIRRKESIFFSSDTSDHHILFSQRKKSIFTRNSTSSLKKQKDSSMTPGKPIRSVSWEVICYNNTTSSINCSPSGSTEELPLKSDKKKFHFLMKKYVPGIKHVKCNGTIDKVPKSIERTQSNPIA